MIKIGAVMTTSGPAALLGSSFLKAIQLAKEDLTNTTHHYDLLIEEIPSPDKAERAIQNLIKIAKVDALVVGLSISGQIVKPYVTAAKFATRPFIWSKRVRSLWCSSWSRRAWRPTSRVKSRFRRSGSALVPAATGRSLSSMTCWGSTISSSPGF